MSDGTENCLVCGAPPNMIGIVVDTLGERRPCVECCNAEEAVGTFVELLADTYDRDFGVGVPGLIAEECYALRDMLHAKQRAYGNSALEPLRIMSKADPVEQIRVRIDDKLSRLARGSDAGEDTIQDLLGYLILLRVAHRLKSEKP